MLILAIILMLVGIAGFVATEVVAAKRVPTPRVLPLPLRLVVTCVATLFLALAVIVLLVHHYTHES